MTPLQRSTVQTLQAEGFQVIVQAKEIVRLTKGADRRVVMQDGSQRRGNHNEIKKGARA